jgi:uncharacterized MAPEG superfamily protein
MTRDQKIVAVGAASGVFAMLAGLVVLGPAMASLPPLADAGERLAYAFKWSALASAPLFIAIIAVGNSRFATDAIDPTANKDSKAVVIDARVIDNTLQQFVLFVVATSALAAISSGNQVGLIAAAAIIFVASRIAFWIGYRIDPLYRAFGFASTAYLNITVFGVALWRAWS